MSLAKAIQGCVLSLALSCGLAGQPGLVAQEAGSATLLRVVTADSKVYVGQVIENGKQTVKFFDLVSNEQIEIAKAGVKQVVNPLSFDEAVNSIGLPRLLSWKINLLAKQMNTVGKVAKVTPQSIYVTLGKNSGARTGNVLSVYRSMGEIKDPVTGEVLGSERPLISQLEITEVSENYSKAKITSNVEVPIEVGDEVESKNGLVVAVFPIRNQDGELSNVGATMSEDITTSLVQARVKVVERSTLETVLAEQLVSNSLLFEPKSAQKIGELTGAAYVVTGKIVPGRTNGTAFVRLVEVKSGDIALAVSASVKLSANRSGSTGRAIIGSNNTGGGSGSFKDGRLPNFLASTSRISKSKKGIVLAEGGVIRTKDVNFLDRDFTFEVLLDNSLGGAHVGMGLTNTVQLQLHTTAVGDNRGEVKLNESIIGHILSTGAHLVRIQKAGDTVTFHIDVDNDGPTPDDLETIVPNIREHSPSFHSKNVPLFILGKAELISASLK